MGNKNIKPCPFCGGPAFSYTINLTLTEPLSYGYVECESCSVTMPAATEEKAVELWNRRADDA